MTDIVAGLDRTGQTPVTRELAVDAGGRPLIVNVVIASDGVALPLDSLAQTPTYNGDGTLATVTVAYLGKTYVQTTSWLNGAWAGDSQWVLQ